jgi:hypothetical protein
MGRLTNRILSIPAEETRVTRRGFSVRESRVKLRLESIGETFLFGYHAALRDEGDAALTLRLRAIDIEMQGFAFEGAAMSLTLLDHMLPLNRGRFQRFLAGDGQPHAYMLHVGAGWALARLPWLRWRTDAFLRGLDPLLRWLAMDGYGFHQGYFYWPRSVRRQEIPRGLSGYARRAFDQGLGRSLWFVEGADADQIGATICAFSQSRRADLWSGVGLASAYAGGVSEVDLESLRESAGEYLSQVAQGAAFAAKARQRAGNPAAHTDLACRVLCRASAERAAAVTDSALEDLPPDGAEPAYEAWRLRIQEQLRMSFQVAGGVFK